MENHYVLNKLIFATNNRYKFEEIKNIIGNKINLLSLSDIGFNEEIPEEQNTLEGNAAQKAFYIYKRYGIDCFSDDTGLEIDGLNGEPGVFSARYAGENSSDIDRINLILSKMKNIENRNAKFRTVIALVNKNELFLFEGVVNGIITRDIFGNNGFGYDPIFKPYGYNKTFAEMSISEKNKISHRGIAISKFSKHILNDLN